MLHLKDMDVDDRSFAPVGTGVLPLDGLLSAAKRATCIAYLIVEQDRAVKETPLDAIETSYKTLSAKGYA
jgi:sugar phosphate isomerase/epimerase